MADGNGLIVLLAGDQQEESEKAVHQLEEFIFHGIFFRANKHNSLCQFKFIPALHFGHFFCRPVGIPGPYGRMIPGNGLDLIHQYAYPVLTTCQHCQHQ